MDLSYLTINRVKEGLRTKKFSCIELVKYYYTRIENFKDLNCYITLNKKEALKLAKVVDQKIKIGEKLKKLEGVPCSIKDLIMTKGLVTTAASKMLEEYVAPYDAFVVKKLKESGAIILGKNNCDEFAMGASNETSAYGPVLNPWDKTRVPGGSSGGSAVSVASDLGVFSIGTDTGGSVRQPGALSGVTALKPTYGRVSRYGLIAMTSSLDQAGPLTHSVEESAQILEIIAGEDKDDSTTSKKKVEKYTEVIKKDIKGKVIGIPKEYFVKGMDMEIEIRIKEMAHEFEKLGAIVKQVSLPSTEHALAVYYIILPAEVSSNLARYDGVRYGINNKQTKDLREYYEKTRADGFGNEVKRRIMIGTYVLSSGYQDAYYNQARRVQKIIQKEYLDIFNEVDALLTPTTPTTAFKLGEKYNDPLTMYLCDIYTVCANITGLCAINIPVGLSTTNLPIGLQLMGAPFKESTILNLAHQFQLKTDFHKRYPNL